MLLASLVQKNLFLGSVGCCLRSCIQANDNIFCCTRVADPDAVKVVAQQKRLSRVLSCPVLSGLLFS